jgi:hypothetical protein
MFSRHLLLLLLAVGVSACGSAHNDGYSQTRTDAAPFGEAHARCMAVAMNIGGMGQTVAQMSAYQRCMAESGWEDRRHVF